MKANRLIALDIGTGGIRLAEFAFPGAGEIVLLDYRAAPLEMDPQQEQVSEMLLAAAVKRLLGRKPPTGSAAMTLPGHAVFSRLVKLPPVAADKLTQTVRHEAMQNIPFPINEVVWDYHLVEAAEGVPAEVLLVAAKAELVEGLAHAVGAAGLPVDVLDVSPVALCNAVRHSYPDLATSLVVDVGARSTNLVFIDGHRTFFRSLPVAGNMITQQIAQELNLTFAQAEALKLAHTDAASSVGSVPESAEGRVVRKCVCNVFDRMLQEISRSIAFHQNQQAGRMPERLLLAGGTAAIPGLDERLSKQLHVQVEFLDPLRHIRLGPDIDAAVVEGAGFRLGELVGLAVRQVSEGALKLNLLPERIRKERRFQRRQPLIVACAAVAVLIAAVGVFGLSGLARLTAEEVEQVGRRIEELTGIESRLKPIEQELRTMEKQGQVFQALVGRRTFWLESLMALGSAVPEGMFLASVEPLWAERRDEEAPANRFEIPLTGLRISVISYLDKEPEGADAVLLLRDRIRDLPAFSGKTEVVRRPTKKAFAREFEIDVFFEEPVKL